MSERKTVKTYTTATGTQQYGSEENFRKHANKAFKRFIDNPNDKNLEIAMRLKAGLRAATAKELRLSGSTLSNFYDRLEKINLTAAQKTRAKSLLRSLQ